VPVAGVLIDAATVADGSTIEADLCIVGGGPAGLTLATDLVGSGFDVVLLESGREAWDQRTQDLADGAVTAEPFRFNGVDLSLSNTRMRQLGGSSNHWTGQCRPLDPHDFDARTATGGVGWPFGFAELEPHYVQAVATVELLSPEWSPAWWSAETGTHLLETDERIRSVVFQFSPPTRFGERLAPGLRAAANVRCYLGATVTSLVPDRSGASVRTADVATFAGTRFQVAATGFVLATGGVDVPRLLLASTAASPAGLGNGNGLVGRFFMEHPHAIGGRALLSVPADQLAAYLIGPRSGPDLAPGLTWTGLSPTPEVQDDEGIANGCVLLWPPDAGPPRGDRDAETWSVDALRSILAGPSGTGPVSEVTLAIRIEQAPNPDSRVVLAPASDELGMPRAEVQWRLTDRDRTTLRRTAELVAESIGASGLGRVEIDPGGRPIEDWPIEIGNHHMGTTRMSTDPADGVVDENGRMHEVDNVHVCGSAVFPTSGMANPTLTIVALAHRLAAQLLSPGSGPMHAAPGPPGGER
jgi:choline dehydrogenase-like flavoprotein